MGRSIAYLEKLAILAATLIVVIGLIILVGEWRNEFLFQFFFTGQWENLLYLLAFSLSAAYLLKKLLGWEAAALFRRRR